MNFDNLLENHEVFIFDLDEVVYPKKDFLLQVYYLFAQFMEYTEQLDASEILTFMKTSYLNDGEDDVFENTAVEFKLDLKYKVNYNLLLRTARLPLKLLIHPECRIFMQAILNVQKKIFLLVSGNPEAQLNKIRQIEWEGLASNLTVFFTEEIRDNELDSGLNHLISSQNLTDNNILIIESVSDEMKLSFQANVNFISSKKLYFPD
jgi:hypothetical protein